MKRSIKLLFALFVIVLFTQASESQAFSERTMVKMVNQYRTIPLKVDRNLSRIAQTKANDMADKGYFGHTTPDGNKFSYFLYQMGYSYNAAGENLAMDYKNNQAVVDAWMDSPSHYTNIMNPIFTKTGIGIACRGSHVYIVQLFIEPYTYPSSLKD